MPQDSKKSESGQPARAGEPNLALILTWLVPGAGHMYLGRPVTAVLGFVVIEGLYALGIMLSGGMFLEYLPLEMRSRFAGALTPEVGNLGALIYQVKTYGYGLVASSGQPLPRAWPSTMDIGTTLTAASGILNILLMSRAHLDARRPVRPPGLRTGPSLAAFATWLVPGGGQVLQGRVFRGAMFFVLLVGLLLLGTWLADGSNLDRERHFYYWAGQFMAGLPAIVLEFIHGHQPVAADIQYADAGVVIASVAGLLNILGMLDAYSYSEDRILAADSSGKAAEQGEGAKA
jgi:hypothetical protein